MRITVIAALAAAACAAAPPATVTAPDASTCLGTRARGCIKPTPDAPAADATIPDAPADTRPPLILLIHGRGFTGPREVAYEHMAALGSAAVVIAPTSPVGSWDASTACCAPTVGSGAPPGPDYLIGLVEQRIAVGDVNPARVYTIGHSNGGFMVWRLLCERPDLFRGGVVFDGAANAAGDPACVPSSPIHVLHVHGTLDAVVGYAYSAKLPEMTEPYPPAIGPGGSTDQEATAAVCSDVYRPAGQVTGAIGVGEGSGSADLEVDAFTRTCAGRADLWRVDGGPHEPTLTDAWPLALLTWLDGRP